MHPTFVELFLQDGAEDLLAEEDKRRTARSRRTRSRRAAKVTVRARDRPAAGGDPCLNDLASVNRRQLPRWQRAERRGHHQTSELTSKDYGATPSSLKERSRQPSPAW